MIKRVYAGVRKTLKRLDLFGSPVTLLFEGEEVSTSALGGAGTVIILILFFTLFNNNIVGFFNLSFVSFNSYYENSLNYNMVLNGSNSLLALGLINHNLLNSSLFKLTILPITRFSNGSRINHDPLSFKQCERSDWANLGEVYAQYFDSNGMSNFVCPFSNYSARLVGQFNSVQFSYIKISIQACSGNNCSKSLAGDIARLVEKGGGYLQLNMAYQNTKIKFMDTFTPFESYPDKTYYRFVPYSSQQSVDMYLEQVEVSTDISVFPLENKITSKNFTYSDAKSFVYVPYSTLQTEFFRCFLRIKNSKLTIDRKVQSLEEFLSFLGGMFSILQILGLLFFTPYSKHQLLLRVYNALNQQRNWIMDQQQPTLIVQPPFPQLHTNFLQFVAGAAIPRPLAEYCGFKKLIQLNKAYDQAQSELDMIVLLKKLSLLDYQKQLMQGGKVPLRRIESQDSGNQRVREDAESSEVVPDQQKPAAKRSRFRERQETAKNRLG